MDAGQPAPDVPAAPGGASFVCWGIADDGNAIEIRTPADMVHRLAAYWPPLGLARTENPRGSVLCTVDVVDGTWERLESELAIFAAERLAGLVAVHTAVIVHGGQAILVPGASGTGKSTLCVAAVAVGARVLSDEYALVDPSNGLVTGWPRPVRLRRRDGGIDRLHLTVSSAPVPVGLVAMVTHTPAAAHAWAPITAAEAVIGLMNNTVCASSRPDESLDAALAIARTASAIGGTRGEADSAIVDLLALLNRPTASG